MAARRGSSILSLPTVLLTDILMRDGSKSALRALHLSTVCRSFQEAVRRFTKIVIADKRTCRAMKAKFKDDETRALEIAKLVSITPEVESLIGGGDRVAERHAVLSWSKVIGATLEELIIRAALSEKHFRALLQFPVLERLTFSTYLGLSSTNFAPLNSVKEMQIFEVENRASGRYERFFNLFPKNQAQFSPKIDHTCGSGGTRVGVPAFGGSEHSGNSESSDDSLPSAEEIADEDVYRDSGVE